MMLDGGTWLGESLASGSQGCAHLSVVTVVTRKSHVTWRKGVGFWPGLHALNYTVPLQFSHYGESLFPSGI